MPDWLALLVGASTLAFAILAGVFLAFSDFIMRALSVTSGHGGAEAMQAINREVFRYVFMTLFLGMVPVSIALGLGAWLRADAPVPVILAALLYLVGCFGITVVRNVPMNEALARLDVASPDGLTYWSSTYLPSWTFWNSVRTGACAMAAVLLLVALTRPISG